ncbi:hypothetical protein MTO96_001366 [Rhipicephalus appendiculatus]
MKNAALRSAITESDGVPRKARYYKTHFRQLNGQVPNANRRDPIGRAAETRYHDPNAPSQRPQERQASVEAPQLLLPLQKRSLNVGVSKLRARALRRTQPKLRYKVSAAIGRQPPRSGNGAARGRLRARAQAVRDADKGRAWSASVA